MGNSTTVIGVDEAGYGPNIGPLVIAATAWSVPVGFGDLDFWTSLQEVVTQDPGDADRLQIADSKLVYSPQRGRARLEQSVLSALRLFGHQPTQLENLCHALDAEFDPQTIADPALTQFPQALPDVEPADFVTRWTRCCNQAGIVPRRIACRIIWPLEFNRRLLSDGNKSTLLSRSSLGLVRRLWHPATEEPVNVVCDKHGGRNRYHDLLAEVADGEFVEERFAGRERSCYRVRRTDWEFRTRAEAHLPVALASMTAKYVRELSLDAVNAFWAAQVADLKPTKGYPTDAKRFRQEIADARQRLGIPWEVIWRDR